MDTVITAKCVGEGFKMNSAGTVGIFPGTGFPLISMVAAMQMHIARLGLGLHDISK